MESNTPEINPLQDAIENAIKSLQSILPILANLVLPFLLPSITISTVFINSCQLSRCSVAKTRTRSVIAR